MISPMAAWYSRNSAITSSGSELSEKPVKPRRSQNSAVISRRWLSSCFSAPEATIRFGYLRRKETSQLTHALDFADLIRDTLFKLLVQLVEIVEQSRILDGDDGLGGESLERFNLFFGERNYFPPIDANRTYQFLPLEHRHNYYGAHSSKCGKGCAVGIIL